jgi:hypothetical protein
VDETREPLEQTAAMAADFSLRSASAACFRRRMPMLCAQFSAAAARGPERSARRDCRVAGRCRAPGVVAISSGRYFGFVIGGAVPAALAADW